MFKKVLPLNSLSVKLGKKEVSKIISNTVAYPQTSFLSPYFSQKIEYEDLDSLNLELLRISNRTDKDIISLIDILKENELCNTVENIDIYQGGICTLRMVNKNKPDGVTQSLYIDVDSTKNIFQTRVYAKEDERITLFLLGGYIGLFLVALSR